MRVVIGEEEVIKGVANEIGFIGIGEEGRWTGEGEGEGVDRYLWPGRRDKIRRRDACQRFFSKAPIYPRCVEYPARSISKRGNVRIEP